MGLWLPVAVGASGLPLAGSDVFISFLDSDPDRPVICAASNIQHPQPPQPPPPRGDTRLLLDWLVNRPDMP
jgi:type VI secretion system secreted protein VgrG